MATVIEDWASSHQTLLLSVFTLCMISALALQLLLCCVIFCIALKDFRIDRKIVNIGTHEIII